MTRSGCFIRRLLAACVVVCGAMALPQMAFAQEAVLSGTVTDSSGGVLPGVTVTAIHTATGNSFLAVTDERGGYRVPVRIGQYRISADLQGFAVVTKAAELLVGQTAIVNLQMAPSTVQESIIVNGEAPLVDTATSTLGGNIDKRQMQDLPINGRNWMDLAMLAPGSRQNESSNIPQARQGYSQINIDGQQITHLIPGTDQNQPSYSMDAIAEFVVLTNRFDATQGRSSGMLANAVTKSGTNIFSGTLAGFFRSDRFNASDFIQNRVVPYQDQQVVTTFGGPIKKDRIHFFGNYEQERQPQTVTFSSPYPAFNNDLEAKNRQRKGIVRGDVQISSGARFMTRFQKYYNDLPNGSTGGATSHPSTARREQRHSNELFSTLTQVIGTGAVNEVKGGVSLFNYTRDSAVTWKGGCFPDAPVRCGGSQTITLRGYSIGSAVGQDQTQNNYSIRDDFTFSFDKGGRQDVKIGGEYVYQPTVHLVVRDLYRQPRREQRARTGQHPIALPGVERCIDLEPRAAVADCEALHDERVEHQVPLQDTAESLRRLAAGRLEGEQPADAESRPALRRADRRQLRGHGVPAVDHRRHSVRPEQLRPEGRLRVHD